MAAAARRSRGGAVVLGLLLLGLCAGGAAGGPLRYSVREELPHGAFVGSVASDLGVDPRRLAARGARLTSGTGRQYLELELGRGALLVRERMDREALCELSPTCFLSLELVIEQPIEVHNVEVEVLDINDNAPCFPRQDYRLEISESAMPGARFHIESAQDPDVGTNSVQSYQLSPSRHFALDLKGFQSGSKLLELVLQQPLDREQSALEQLVLTAVDGGDPPKSGTAQISVRVVDTNDNPPTFDRSTYTVSLLENALPGTLVVKLNASDPDEGSNGEVVYSFGSYTPQKVRQLFSVDPHSGEVRVNGTLDYEEASSYEIYVQAADQGPVSMAGHCKVLVNIVDANDNAPEVVLTSLYSPVPEDAKAGTVVALMSVTDQDSGLNKQVSLRIPPGLPFTLNSFKNSYTLVTQGNLDHEKAAAYNITVTATDSGSPPLSSQKVIYVEISDINDNPPRFEEPVYSVYIPENNPLGAFMCTIKATDPDVAENAYVSYSLLDGEIEGLPVTSYVSIKSDSGNMYAVRSFDYETLREFQVVVQAQDAGIPSLSSTVTVYIYVVDENDHAPQILYPTSTNTSAALEMIPRSAYAGYLPKHPNPDWRYSASLRAGMQSAVHMEEAGILRGGPGGPDQQWPTVSSATTEPEAGEVSPPVGAGVNSNSWTFKFGPGNPKQGGPGELPDKFIIPGSPAIISIRQEPPNSQIDKSDFITFGKKEETKKKKKKKKGNKTQEKKEKGNSTTENSDQ
ncbi:protocadherin alpha-C2-like isoform X14 [Strigops habroptila]|uniref:protocadherin alpha-C2-like isoform X14 n=1 Tax=Strigops habroptila TaxID=2489341 RepID=UPI0011D01D21|nr:protocadherin alpha-C2-like isoform X14 [Strigops habroptila]